LLSLTKYQRNTGSNRASRCRESRAGRKERAHLALTKKSSVAIVQMKSSEDKHDNLQRSVEWMAEAADKGAALVCFPEFQMAYSPATQSAKELSSIAESATGNFVSTLSGAARRNRIGAIVTIYEKSRKGTRVFDSAVEISPKGQVVSVY